MKIFVKIILVMAIGLCGVVCQARKAPKGNLIYCSYSQVGTEGLGKEYCELIADPGTEPRVHVVLNQGNRFHYPEVDQEFSATPEDVQNLQNWLKENKVYKLDGYNLQEAITGGKAYRIYMEYDSGDKVEARWYGIKVKDKALEAYHYIYTFFKPWREAIPDKASTSF